MELGGHSPVVVFADADPEKAADTIAAFKYRNAGQVCISPTRFYVHENHPTASSSRASPNMPRASRWATDWKRASPWARSPIRAGSTPWTASSTTPRNRGGKIVTGGSRHGNQGFFFQPTVITDVPDDCQDHDRGAVRPCGADRALQDLRRSGRTRQLVAVRSGGLCVHRIRTRPLPQSATRCSPAWSALTASPISTPETPFGGIKESGYGSEGGMEGLQAYMNTKFISQA